MKTKSPMCRCGNNYPSTFQRLVIEAVYPMLEPDSADQRAVANATLHGDLGELNLIHPQSIHDVGRHCGGHVAATYQLRSLLEKFCKTDRKSAQSRRAKAVEKFHLVEQSLAAVNARMCDYQPGLFDPDSGTDYSAYMRRAEDFILGFLGYFLPPPDQLLQSSRFGPGTSIGNGKAFTNTYFKYARWPYTCPERGRDPSKSAIINDARWYGALIGSLREQIDDQFTPLNMSKVWSAVLSPVDINRITTVPKNSEIDRVIAIESTLGVYLQLGVDGFIRSRLKKYRIDLDDQEPNASAALSASVDDDLATLDLSSASDCLSRELVRSLLPKPWFDYLDSIRSHVGCLPNGDLVSYEKFSSMGNGYTFALESLVFYSLCRAVVPKSDIANVYVYGDDLIVPSAYADVLVGLLEYCGFKTNSSKSFTSGPFRESCGCHAWNGFNITPVRLKGVPSDLMSLAMDYNRMFLWFAEWQPETSFPATALARWLKSLVPTGWLFEGPADRRYADCWFFDDRVISFGKTLVIKGYGRGQCPRTPRNFTMAKMMHSLKTCESDSGTRFSIPQGDENIGVYSTTYEVFTEKKFVPWVRR